jgi:hypothetical protein
MLIAENVAFKTRIVQYETEAESCRNSARRAEEAAERALRALTVSQKAAEIAEDTARAALQDRDHARTRLEEGEFMSRYSDYAKDEVRSIQRGSGYRWCDWVAVENELVGERIDYDNDMMDGRPTTPYLEHPAHVELARICSITNRTPDVASDIIVFYKERCHNVHSGLQQMSVQEKGSKVRRNAADLNRMIPDCYTLYKHGIESAIRAYARRYGILL